LYAARDSVRGEQIMRISRSLTKWTIAGLAAGLTVSAGIAVQTIRSPARAQLTRATELTPAQLTRLQQMQGQFVYESGPSRPELWKSIEVGTTGLDPAQARHTRAQLEQLLGAPPSVELALETEGGAPSLSIQEGRSKASAPPTGEARAVVPKGARPDVQPLQLSQRLEETALLRVIEGKGFRQERRFSLSADGNSLAVQIHISGAALPSPLSASYVFRRL
jgi:hypothetical protein